MTRCHVDDRGRFIVFEGGEGCGKSTQSKMLAARLDAIWTREPGDTPLGRRIRDLLLDRTTVAAPRTEALLMAADRAQHVVDVIEPALAVGRHVVCDRFVGSSVAYQGYGRGLDPDEVAGLSTWGTDGCRPDLVVLLEVPATVSSERLGADLDRFESAGDEFHERVRAGFVAQAEQDRSAWARIDGVGSVDEVAARVWASVEGRLGLQP